MVVLAQALTNSQTKNILENFGMSSFAFSAGFLLALNKERQRHIFRKNCGAALGANTTNGSGITANKYYL